MTDTDSRKGHGPVGDITMDARTARLLADSLGLAFDVLYGIAAELGESVGSGTGLSKDRAEEWLGTVLLASAPVADFYSVLDRALEQASGPGPRAVRISVLGPGQGPSGGNGDGRVH